MKNKYTIILVVFILILFIMKGNNKSFLDFIQEVEGFRSTPYWDFKQWTWGYGTRVPDSIPNPAIRPNKVINKQMAAVEANNYAMNDRRLLQNKLTRPLSTNQWTALLSFSYNLGLGNAYLLIPNINKRNNKSLETQWKSYINAGGVPSSNLIARRNKEWNLFIS